MGTRRNKNIKRKRNIILISVIVVLLCLIITTVYATTKSKVNKFSINNEPVLNSIVSNDVLYIKMQEFENQIEAEENVVENTVTEEKKTEEKKNNTATYYVKVNNSANVVTVYAKDGNGEYTVPVRAMVCSTGSATPRSGKYTVPGRRSRWRALYGNVYGQWVTNIVGAILFHSVPYLENENPGSLEYWEYDKLGTAASMGCVRLTTSDAQWVYNNIPAGTIVEFYSDSNPGPLGKPSAQKISGNVECRNWDPTDYTNGNPWRNQKKEEPKPVEQNTIKQEENKVENATTTTNIITNTTTNTTITNLELKNNVVENTTSTDIVVENKISETKNEQVNNTTETIDNSENI